MSIKIDNKFPTTEEEKQNMKQPYATDKCPKKYAIVYQESSLRSAKIIGTVHADYPKSSHSVMVRTRALPSSRKSLLLTRKLPGFVNAVILKISRSVMALIRSLTSDFDLFKIHNWIIEFFSRKNIQI
jgi:hypothetical protein